MSHATEKAEVIAVFDRCCYLQLEGQLSSTDTPGLLCVGHSSIQPGPLNCLVEDHRWACVQPRLKTGTFARLSQTRLTLGGLCIDLPYGLSYRSPELSTLCKTLLGVVLGRLEQLAAFSPVDSLSAHCLCPQRSSCNSGAGETPLLHRAVVNYVAPLLSTLREDLESALANPADSLPEAGTTFAGAEQLLGAGSGLTPAGDDLLAGVLLALWFFNESATAHRLHQHLLPYAPSRTNVISLALLRQAAAGRTSLPLVNLFTAIGHSVGYDAGETDSTFNPSALAELIDAMGHSSGWDCVAGIALATQALQKSRTTSAGIATRSLTASTPTRLTFHA